MTDYHVHIGQWNSFYFYADRIFAALKENGIDECWFSSTTSCVFAEPNKLFESVQKEIKDALFIAKEISIKARPLYWVVPDIISSGISIEKAMGEIPYEGFKIHPRAQDWNIGDKNIYMLAENIFSYAEKNNLRIMIHTGLENDIDSPRKFEPLIKNHPNCIVQLAHIKDLNSQEYMLKTYKNVFVDSSFSEQQNVEDLLMRGIDSKRILWGSDMPIGYWLANHNKPQKENEPDKNSLSKFYRRGKKSH